MTAAAQLGLLDWAPPPSAPHVAGSDTSRDAARAIRPALGDLQARVLECLRTRGGLTDEQIQDALGMAPSTQRPRRVELERAGYARDSGERRSTRSGRRAVVWVAT